MTTDPFWAVKDRLRVRSWTRRILPAFDFLLVFPTALMGLYLYVLKRLGLSEMRLSKRALERVGIWPIRRHYYEPYFDQSMLRRSLTEPRDLPGLDLAVTQSLELVSKLSRYSQEPLSSGLRGGLRFLPENGTYGLADAALLYAMVRHWRPARVIEIGSGNSTLVLMQALDINRSEGAGCEHLCIEPYEMPWLESTGATVVRTLVEDVDLATFEKLEGNDILFVDNSHMIRPQGDVLTVVQSILPRLRPGVIVHIHDLFTPRDYPEAWLLRDRCMWNEQYLVEAFLTFNDRFETLVAANHLFVDHRAAYNSLRAELNEPQDHPPAAFWIRRRHAEG